MYTLPSENIIKAGLSPGKFFAAILILFVFVWVLLLLYRLQFVDGDSYFNASVDNALDNIIIPAERGKIITSDGRVIAKSVIREEDGVEDREYSMDRSGSVVTGYASGTGVDDVILWTGRDGVEKYYDEILTGVDGMGLDIEHFDGSLDTVVVQSPVSGDDVYLTIDSRWQATLYNLVGKHVSQSGALGAAGVIMESDTGKIMSMVSFPTYSASGFSTGVGSKEYQGLLDDPGLPLMNKVVGMRASPGSIFKPVISGIGLAKGVLDVNKYYYSAGCENIDASIKFCEADGKVLGNVNFKSAISRSSNLYFCNLAKKIIGDGENTSIGGLLEQLDMYMLERRSGIDIVGEVIGSIPSPEGIASREGRIWGVGDVCNMAIGQGDVLVTPIRMVTIAAAFVNGGDIVRPYIYDYSVDVSSGVVRDNLSEVVGELSMDLESLEIINNAMRYAVTDSQGSGRQLVSVPGNIRIKTGSADASEVLIDGQVRSGAHSWVMGTFTSDGINYSFVIMQQFGGRGYLTVPIVGGFVECVYGGFSGEGCK